jgi:hypothetical protein
MPKTITKAAVLKGFHTVHGDRYDYSKVRYVKMHTKVTIICKLHGEFTQTPNSHLQGHGCALCGLIKATEKRIDIDVEAATVEPSDKEIEHEPLPHLLP